MMRALLAAVMLCAFAAAALAHPHSHWRHRRPYTAQGELRDARSYQSWAWSESSIGRPRDCYGIPWCGCWLRHLFGIADTTLNLAANWTRWGRAAWPAEGVVVVWRHHVGIIRGGPDAHGRWLVQSGNDGHAVRTRYRSLAGAIAFRQG